MQLFYKVLMKALLIDSCLYICESDGCRETTSIVINSETPGRGRTLGILYVRLALIGS